MQIRKNSEIKNSIKIINFTLIKLSILLKFIHHFYLITAVFPLISLSYWFLIMLDIAISTNAGLCLAPNLSSNSLTLASFPTGNLFLMTSYIF